MRRKLPESGCTQQQALSPRDTPGPPRSPYRPAWASSDRPSEALWRWEQVSWGPCVHMAPGELVGKTGTGLAQHHCGSVCSGPSLGIPCGAAFSVCSSHRAADRASGRSQDVGKGPLCTAVPAGTSSCHRSHMASSVYEICSQEQGPQHCSVCRKVRLAFHSLFQEHTC